MKLSTKIYATVIGLMAFVLATNGSSAAVVGNATQGATSNKAAEPPKSPPPPPPPPLQVGEIMRPMDIADSKAVKACTDHRGTVSKDKAGRDVCITKVQGNGPRDQMDPATQHPK